MFTGDQWFIPAPTGHGSRASIPLAPQDPTPPAGSHMRLNMCSMHTHVYIKTKVNLRRNSLKKKKKSHIYPIKSLANLTGRIKKSNYTCKIRDLTRCFVYHREGMAEHSGESTLKEEGVI